MDRIVIVIHLLVVVALVGLILMQRSEGGGLGIGGGGGFMSARGAANALTRTTAILAVAFFVTSLGLSLIARYQERPVDIFDRLPQNETQQDGGGAGILDELGGAPSAPSPSEPSAPSPSEETPSVPTGEGAAAPAETAPPAPVEEPVTPAPQLPSGQ